MTENNANNTNNTTTPASGEVRHTGQFNIDVALSGNTGNNIDQKVQAEVRAAVDTFKSDINNRLSAVEKSDGQIPRPPTIERPAQTLGNILV